MRHIPQRPEKEEEQRPQPSQCLCQAVQLHPKQSLKGKPGQVIVHDVPETNLEKTPRHREDQ